MYTPWRQVSDVLIYYPGSAHGYIFIFFGLL